MNSLNPDTTVRWARVIGVGALHGAITITWIVYNLYLPELLAQFGFPAIVTRAVLVIENVLAIIIEPTMGGLSDRAVRWWNSRFPFILGGVLVAAVTFMIIPVTALAGSPAGAARWLLPLFLVGWALAMATFRSPSLALLKKCAADKDLPRAAAVLTVLAGFFAAVRPFSTDFILSLGPLAAFASGSGGLLLGALVLRQLLPGDEPEQDSDGEPQGESGHYTLLNDLKPHFATLALIFGAGLGGAWSFRFATTTVSKLLAVQFPDANDTVLMSIFFFLLMAAGLPLGAAAAKIGNHQAMLLGIGAAAGGLVAVGLWPNVIFLLAATVLVLAGLSVATTGAVPFALSLMPSRWGGLSIGMYFGGFAFAMSWFHALFSPILDIASAGPVAFLGAASFLISWLCIAASLNKLPDQEFRWSPQTALFGAGAILVAILFLGWLARP